MGFSVLDCEVVQDLSIRFSLSYHARNLSPHVNSQVTLMSRDWLAVAARGYQGFLKLRNPCLLFIGQGNRRRGDKHQRKKAKTHFRGFYSLIHLWGVHSALVLKRGGTL
jgi:hypothetical protein